MDGAGEQPSPTADFLTRSFKRRISDWQADVQSHNPPQTIPPVPKKRKVLQKSKSSKSESLRATAKEHRADRDNRTPGDTSSRHRLRRKSSSKDLRPSHHQHGMWGAGKFSRATRTIGVGVGGFLKRLSGWCSAQGCIPTSFRDDIERLDPFTYLPDLVYGGFADDWTERDLGSELDFVTRSVQNSEKLHVASSTETEWVMHAKLLLEHAFKSYESTVSVLVATTVDLEPALLPIDMGRLSAPPRLQTSTTRPRKNSISSATESDTGQYDTTPAKVDITIGLDKTDPVVAEFLKDLEAVCRTRAPTAFTHSIPFPLIPVKVKDETGSSLAAEYETTLCASAMLASWSSASATTASATANTVNLNSSMMQTDDLAPTEVLDEDATVEIKPSPLVLTLSVIGANWYYNVVYTDDIRDFTGTRHVLGPFLIGQSRNFLGTFQILRFLRMACEWGVKEWVKDMCEKLGESEDVNRGLAKLME
ncbi:uncharacterized protein DFL_008116 [Arthrobotrys flagrans]|uniref:PD-(D/E)XK nuclease-like domain-containing protein n=1 Tax=Arthrobotrys flagrans TaxID=97331 RepID=A0A436ZMV2_ARTFL|nr:hypothetical protein DFL_008116 [Arthrobotrys flagrans]